jgi:hypothetical protein
MNLSTVARIRSYLGMAGQPNDANEAGLSAALATVSAAVERYLDRKATRIARTVYVDVEPMGTLYRLDAFPITALAGAWFDPDQDFGTDTALTSTDYLDPTLGDRGVFQTKYPLSGGYRYPMALKLTFTGGMATDTASFVTDYPDIAGAVDVQSAHEWQRRNALGVSSISYPDGTTASLSFDRWIPSVKQVLDYHRRLT